MRYRQKRYAVSFFLVFTDPILDGARRYKPYDCYSSRPGHATACYSHNGGHALQAKPRPRNLHTPYLLPNRSKLETEDNKTSKTPLVIFRHCHY